MQSWMQPRRLIYLLSRLDQLAIGKLKVEVAGSEVLDAVVSDLKNAWERANS